MKDMWTNIIRLIKKRWNLITDIPADLSRLADYAQPLFIMVVITILSFLLVDIFYKGFSLQIASRPTTAKSQFVAAASPHVPVRTAEYYNIITERNLFLTTLQAIADENSVGDLLPGEEYTAFDLKGTIAINESMGYVIVEEKGKDKQKLYRLGEMIGSARLVRIARNAAVLQDGEKEFVMKVKDVAKGSVTGGTSSMENGGAAISRQEVAQSLGDMKSVMSQAVVRPFLSAGVPQGFIVSNIVPGSVYQRLGLQNGDVVVDVNNKKLEGADDVIKMVNMMQAGGSISINVMRNGKNETINHSF
ncbi:MAG: PDZ domain-containing protein [Smithellaceae bacterium]